MSKKRIITLMVVLIILTNIITFGATNLLTIKYKDKVILPAKEYDKLTSFYKKYTKAMAWKVILKKIS